MTNEKCHSEQHQTSQTNEEPLKTQTQVNPQALLSPHRFTSYTAPSPNSFIALFYKVKQSPFFGLCLSNRSGFGELEFPHKHVLLSSSVSCELGLKGTEYMTTQWCSVSSPMNSGQVF